MNFGAETKFERGALSSQHAHDVIAITSPQKNDLCTEELRDRVKSLDEVSLPLRKARFGCLFFRKRKETLELTLG